MFELVPILVGLAAGGLLAARRAARLPYGAAAVVIGVVAAVVAGELPGEAWSVIVDTTTAATGLAMGSYVYRQFVRPASERRAAEQSTTRRSS